jgi:DNA-binding YbaB/EbfC family protein
MKNLGQMLKQAQEMQTKLATAQEQLEGIEIDGAAGGGMVKVTLSGRGKMRRVRIDPSLVQAGDTEVIEDLIVAADNDARTKVEARAAEEMSKVTGGLNLPAGLKLPF